MGGNNHVHFRRLSSLTLTRQHQIHSLHGLLLNILKTLFRKALLSASAGLERVRVQHLFSDYVLDSQVLILREMHDVKKAGAAYFPLKQRTQPEHIRIDVITTGIASWFTRTTDWWSRATRLQRQSSAARWSHRRRALLGRPPTPSRT